MEKFRWAYIGNGNIANSTARDILRGEHEIVSVYVMAETKKNLKPSPKNIRQKVLMILTAP